MIPVSCRNGSHGKLGFKALGNFSVGPGRGGISPESWGAWRGNEDKIYTSPDIAPHLLVASQ